jgi:16S rRNA (cytosine1402-N4)-methyltransferase
MSPVMITPIHIPVLLKEVLDALKVKPGGRYIDCTLGSGGHAKAILESSQPGGKLLGIDADLDATRLAAATLEDNIGAAVIVNDNFNSLEKICKENNFLQVDGILFDLGISSDQLETSGRGFSFHEDSQLDMRLNPAQQLNAHDIVNTYPEDKLSTIIWENGEERYSQRIARNIVANRPVDSTLKLANIIEQTIGRRTEKIHPATRTFMALRIAVNHELENLIKGLEQVITCLNVEGRLVVISYHTLEDRIVKKFMAKESKGCLCPPSTPICVCNHKPRLRLITKNITTPVLGEIINNPRSRSAKMRVAERI